MLEKPIALQRITDCRETLKALEDSIAAAIEAHGDDFGLKAAAEAHHAALARAERDYLSVREWTLEPEFAALTSGGENKPPQEPGPGGN